MCQIKASVLWLLSLVFVLYQTLIVLHPSKFKFLPKDEEHMVPQQRRNDSYVIQNHHGTQDHINNTYLAPTGAAATPVKPTPSQPKFNQDGAFDICTTFYFVPSNWTLFRKAPFSAKVESKKCQELYSSLFKKKLVKQIVHANKTVENLGCTKRTKMCDDGPYFDTIRNIRVDSPPCCMRNTKYVLKTVTTDLKRAGIPHMLFGGAVLGRVSHSLSVKKSALIIVGKNVSRYIKVGNNKTRCY